jgi:tetratricopeptide (TPR) repeat protein
MSTRSLVLLGVLGLALVALGGAQMIALRPARTAPSAASHANAPAPAAETAAAPAPPASPFDLDASPGRVADAAQALGGFAGTLEGLAGSWMEDLGVDVQVASVNDTERGVDALAPELFQARRVGAEAPTGGILVLLNPARSEARIEVSYQLEPVFPDAFVGRLGQDQLVPYASYGFAGMAVMDVLHFLKDFAYLKAARGELALDASYRERPEFQAKASFLSGGAGARVDLASLPSDAELKARVPDERRGRYAPSRDPLESAAAWERVQGDLAGDPTLEILTPGSRVQRARYPIAPFEELERHRRIVASKPLHAIELGDRAVVDSRTPAPGFVPILLHREGGLWRVDQVETWKNLMFDQTGEYVLRNSESPYAFGLRRFGAGEYFDVAAFDLGRLRLDEVIAALESQQDVLSRFLLAEVLFRNCFAAMDALRVLRDVAEKRPRDPLVQKTLADRALYVGLPDLAIPALERLGAEGTLGLAEAHQAAGRLAEAEAALRRALERNRFDRAALARLAGVLDRAGRPDQASAARRELAELEADPERRWMPLQLAFDPPRPLFDGDTPTLVGDAPVHDHTRFAIAMTNPSDRAVEVMSVRVGTHVQGTPGGVGDTRDEWTYPEAGRRIPPGGSATLARTWGFVADKPFTHTTYVFDVCWRGVGSKVKQCRVERVTAFPL